eukprot:m.356178 g.356178  ORF g.356178 m.356178 type:complete len:416 (+) comp19929_c3_seq2:1358-2605(+)
MRRATGAVDRGIGPQIHERRHRQRSRHLRDTLGTALTRRRHPGTASHQSPSHRVTKTSSRPSIARRMNSKINTASTTSTTASTTSKARTLPAATITKTLARRRHLWAKHTHATAGTTGAVRCPVTGRMGVPTSTHGCRHRLPRKDFAGAHHRLCMNRMVAAVVVAVVLRHLPSVAAAMNGLIHKGPRRQRTTTVVVWEGARTPVDVPQRQTAIPQAISRWRTEGMGERLRSCLVDRGGWMGRRCRRRGATKAAMLGMLGSRCHVVRWGFLTTTSDCITDAPCHLQTVPHRQEGLVTTLAQRMGAVTSAVTRGTTVVLLVRPMMAIIAGGLQSATLTPEATPMTGPATRSHRFLSPSVYFVVVSSVVGCGGCVSNRNKARKPGWFKFFVSAVARQLSATDSHHRVQPLSLGKFTFH